MSTSAYKAPSFFPGVIETLFYLVFLFISGLFMEEVKKGEDALLMGVVTLFVMAVGFLLLKRRHKKRTETYPEHPPVLRIRDLAMFGLVGLFAQQGGALFSKVPMVQEMGMKIAIGGVIALILSSVMWGKLCSGKSMVWGGLFCLGGLISLYIASKSLSPLSDAMDGLENANYNTVMLFVSLVLVILGYVLQGIASVFGGLALFKDFAERTKEEMKLMSFIRWAYIALGLGLVFGALATVPENVNSDDEMMRLAITMGTMMGLLTLFAGLGMTKHLKTVGNSAASASETSEAPESSPEPKETPSESTQSDDEHGAATE
jgi:hypothetical protein